MQKCWHTSRVCTQHFLLIFCFLQVRRDSYSIIDDIAITVIHKVTTSSLKTIGHLKHQPKKKKVTSCFTPNSNCAGVLLRVYTRVDSAFPTVCDLFVRPQWDEPRSRTAACWSVSVAALYSGWAGNCPVRDQTPPGSAEQQTSQTLYKPKTKEAF